MADTETTTVITDTAPVSTLSSPALREQPNDTTMVYACESHALMPEHSGDRFSRGSLDDWSASGSGPWQLASPTGTRGRFMPLA